MLNVYLLRHGETAYNADGNRYCGRTDISLTEKGLAQAKEIAAQLEGKKIDAVYSSPLQRAKITAEIACNGHVEIDARLIEIDFGSWEGKTKEEFILENSNSWNQWMLDPEHAQAGLSGESGKQVIERVNSFYKEMLTKHPNGTILVVGHNGINRLYMAYKLGMPLKNYRKIVQENSSITQFELDGDGAFSLKKLNSSR